MLLEKERKSLWLPGAMGARLRRRTSKGEEDCVVAEIMASDRLRRRNVSDSTADNAMTSHSALSSRLQVRHGSAKGFSSKQHPILAAAIGATLLVFVYFLASPTGHSNHSGNGISSPGSIQVVLRHLEPSNAHPVFAMPPRSFEEDWDPHYAFLDFHTLPAKSFKRRIHREDWRAAERQRRLALRDMDESFVAYSLIPDDEVEYPAECERVEWRSKLFPNCNTFHERSRIGETDQYLGHGFYRDAWLKPSYDPTFGETEFVLKQMQMPYDEDDRDHMPNTNSFAKIQREAIIMERLTASPRIVSTYGQCALSVLSESVPNEVANMIVPNSGHAKQSELDALPEFQPVNNYTVAEKLNMVLEMARAIADIHGFPGAIVHGDIHPVQWLQTNDGKLKLNDFNNAEILDWHREDATYCKTDRGTWGGMYRSPEEFVGKEIDEQIDVYSMGNNIYTLLTGLWPFYEFSDYDTIQKKILRLERPHVPDGLRKNYAERKMVEIMERMWADDPHQRPEIFEVVQFLEDTKRSFEEDKHLANAEI